MIEGLSFTNLANDSITLNSDIYPLHLYDDPITERLEEREKSGEDGMWPTYPYESGMEITMEGDILADDADDYWTKRQALISCFRYKSTPRQRKSGVLAVSFDNAPEVMTADVVVRSISAPRNGVSPGFSQFRIVLLSFLPYYIGVDSDDHWYDS